MRAKDRQLHLLALCGIPRIAWHAIAREAQRPGGLDRLLAAELDEQGPEARATRAALKKGLDRLDEHLDRAREAIRLAADADARLTTALPEDDEYPNNLRVIYNLPPFLFYRGELRRDDARSVAVVGTRKASSEGLRRATSVVQALVKNDVTVLSGLAKGIDTAAHEATLEADGRTIAVIGTGIMRTYPKENAELAERIASTGAVVSQFWPDHPPTRSSFPLRNVTMSGMGQGTVVVEASSTSGAKMQARLALEHGKQAFLLRTLVTRQDWARRYLDRGAVEVADVEDVLERLQSADAIENLTARRRQLVLA